MRSSTITDLKKHLGNGIGLRKNKYLLEIPMPGGDGDKINVLTQSASLPGKTITTSSLYHKGRQYNVRGETDFGSTYEITLVDDSDMYLRKQFEDWLKLVDNSRPKSAGLFSGASYEKSITNALNQINSGVNALNKIQDAIKSPIDTIGNFIIGAIDPSMKHSVAMYQTDINIWQLDSFGDKVYGYKLQNAFPSQISSITFEDSTQNSLSEFNITFTFSECEPLESSGTVARTVKTLVGSSGRNIINGINKLL